MAKGKRLKEKNNINKKRFFKLLIIFILIVVACFVCNKGIKKLFDSKNRNVDQNIVEYVEKEYQVEDFENFSFEKVKIRMENDISYVNIDIKNNGMEKSKQKEIKVKFLNKDKQVSVTYILPEIEPNKTYQLTFNVISNLQDTEKIQIENK